MNRTEYRARIHELLADAHELHQQVVVTLDRVSDAGTAEWQLLYSVMNAVGIACNLMNSAVTARPSAFDAAPVAMVCTVCRNPVEGGNRNNDYWYHVSEDDAENCPRLDTIKAMVAEGNERVPLADTTDDAMAARREAEPF